MDSERITRRRLIGGAAAGAASLAWAREDTVTVTPAPIDDLLVNPGMGWQTFHQFADGDRALKGLPSGSAYFRFYWREIEPREGELDTAMLDGLFDRASRAGQRLSFRVMCVGTDAAKMECPSWLKEKGCRGTEFTYGTDPVVRWVPDWEDPVFQKAHFRAVQELGRRYDGHPAIDLLDIGTVGLWGEWHMSGCKDVATGRDAPMPREETRLAIIDAWRRAFPRSPKVMLIGDEPGMRHATHHGCGWRADCLGDKGGFSKNWNHMDHFYLQQITKTGAEDAWKTGPVAFESCWDMRKWVQEGWDVRQIFDYALKLHCSYVNNKSAPIPESARPEVERLLKRLGYRLALKRLSHPATVKAGGPLNLTMEWENAGVAPAYGDFQIVTRLQSPAGHAWHHTHASVKGWLPGAHTVDVTIPAAVSSGKTFDLSIAVCERADAAAFQRGNPGKPVVRLAMAGRQEDGWYPLSKVRVV